MSPGMDGSYFIIDDDNGDQNDPKNMIFELSFANFRVKKEG